MAKKLKNYRLSEETIKQIEDLQNASGRTATELIEAAINYVHEEYTSALEGQDNEAFMLRQILGKRIKKAS